MFGQLIIGPAGSGKSTYCMGMSDFLTAAGRKVSVINLDPANGKTPYECAINISDLVVCDDVQREMNLGPNGAMIYCMEYLVENLDWLEERLDALDGSYVLIDCPGQVELFNMHDSLKKVVQFIEKHSHRRLACVHLVDSHLCTEPGKYLGALLLSLSSMLHLEMPHINVLSKIDLIEKYGGTQFGIEFYTSASEPNILFDMLDNDPALSKLKDLSKGLCELIEDYALVSFTTLNIQDRDSVASLVAMIDKSNGYVFSSLEREAAMKGTTASEFQYMYKQTRPPLDVAMDIEEKYFKDYDDFNDDDDQEFIKVDRR